MDRTIRCLRCGKRLVPVPKIDGRTVLACIRCDGLTSDGRWTRDSFAARLDE
jgi:hypothetical protein